MKTINLFLASSVDEFDAEREIFEHYMNLKSEDQDIDIHVLRCENYYSYLTKEHAQEKFNKAIRESDFCVFLFFTKAGQYTVEEYQVAKHANIDFCVYFKELGDKEADPSLLKFIELLDNDNCKYTYFTDIESVCYEVYSKVI